MKSEFFTRRPSSSGKEDRHEIVTLGSGEITGTAELRDSTSRALLARQEPMQLSPGVY